MKAPKRPKLEQQEHTESYADRAKRATRPKEVTFQWTKMPGKNMTKMTGKTKCRTNIKQEWIKAFTEAVEQEHKAATSASEWGDYEEQYARTLAKVGI